jgi:tRNA A-37 threonylcarbamoyl transferase component Bud32
MDILNNEIIDQLIINEPNIKGCEFKKMSKYSKNITINEMTEKSNENSIVLDVDKKFILKIQKNPNFKEIEFQIKASKNHLSPSIYEVYECKIGDKIKSYAFIMDELDISAKDFILDKTIDLSSKIDILKKIIEKLTNLNKIGIRHNDSLLRNFMLKENDIYIIDFDRSLDQKDLLYTRKNDFNMLYDDLIDELCPQDICDDIELLKKLLQMLTGYTDEEKLRHIPKSKQEKETEEKESIDREKREEEKREEEKEKNTEVQLYIKNIFDSKNISTKEEYESYRGRISFEKKLREKYKNSDIDKEINNAIKFYLL